mgnify:CR=1 FL=1
MPFCPHCGSEVKDPEAQFCSRCGKRIKDDSSKVPTDIPVVPADTTPPASAAQKDKQSGGVGVVFKIIFTTICLFFLGLGLLFLLYIFSEPSTPDSVFFFTFGLLIIGAGGLFWIYRPQ